MRDLSGSGQTRSQMTDILFTLALFCVFAASALLVVVIGAQVYENTTDSMSRNFDVRTSIAYVTTKIRQNDSSEGIYVQELGDTQALVMEQTYEGVSYQTWIYHYDGMLRELFVEQGFSFHPGDGQAILEIPEFRIAQVEEGLFQLISVDSRGIRTEILVGTRC